MTYTRARGASLIHMLTLLFVTSMVGVFAIDMGLNFAAQSQLQTVADSASLAAANELFRSTSSNTEDRTQDAIDVAVEYAEENLSFSSLEESDVILGYIDPDTKEYDKSSFTTPNPDPAYANTGGYNAVRVKVKAGHGGGGDAIPSIMGRLFGVNTMNSTATAISLMDSTIGQFTGGVRPIYTCAEQFSLASADGDPSNDTIRIYGDEFHFNGQVVNNGCPPPGAGNWGFADLRDDQPGAPGNATLSSWWQNGFPDPVNSDEYYSTQPGNSINSNGVKSALNYLMNNEVVFPVPLIDEDYSGNGSNTQVHVVGFAGFQITNYSAHGNNSWIEGKFVKMMCQGNCGRGDGSAVGGGTANLKLVR